MAGETPSDGEVQSGPTQNPYAWLDKVSDEQLDQLFLDMANAERRKFGIQLWENTPAGMALGIGKATSRQVTRCDERL